MIDDKDALEARLQAAEQRAADLQAALKGAEKREVDSQGKLTQVTAERDSLARQLQDARQAIAVADTKLSAAVSLLTQVSAKVDGYLAMLLQGRKVEAHERV